MVVNLVPPCKVAGAHSGVARWGLLETHLEWELLCCTTSMTCCAVERSSWTCSAALGVCVVLEEPGGPLVALQDALVRAAEINAAQGELSPFEVAASAWKFQALGDTAPCCNVIQVERALCV